MAWESWLSGLEPLSQLVRTWLVRTILGPGWPSQGGGGGLCPGVGGAGPANSKLGTILPSVHTNKIQPS